MSDYSKDKYKERIDNMVDDKTTMERYGHYGKDFLLGYIQCLFNKGQINLKEAIKLALYIDSL